MPSALGRVVLLLLGGVFLPAARPAPCSAGPLPAAGGVARIHVPGLPSSLNLALTSSSVGRGIHAEVHETLLRRDSESLRLVPSLAREWVVEDTLVLVPGAEAGGDSARRLSIGEAREAERYLFGRVGEVDGSWTVEPVSSENPLTETLRVPADRVARVERGTVITLRLRDDVRWHDGHPFDAADVVFSWRLYTNPEVDADARRFLYEKIVSGEVLDAHTVRFVYESSYFKALDALAALCLLPAHLYDLRDPDHPDHDLDADDAARADEIEENRHNREWVGLGPYRVAEWSPQWIRAERFEDYFDPERAGHLEELRWRALTSDTVIREALSEGVIDFTDRLPQELFDEIREADPFEGRFRVGHFHRGRYGFIAWNLRREALADAGVRRALAHSFDFDSFNASQYGGLAVRVTGSQNRLGPAYDRSVEPPRFDLVRAEELLAEAGWIDRDGDGRLDRDGKALELELLLPSGNPPGERVGAVLQEAMARIGVTLTLAQLDLAALLARVRTRDFDAVLLAWTQPLESDPEQKWHSRWADAVGSSNFGGLADPVVDELIERGQATLDDEARHAIWRQLQRRIDRLQPYLFLFDAPVFYAMDRGLRGFRAVPVPPNYELRSWSR